MGRLLDKYNQKYGLAEKVQERKDIDSWQELEEENTAYANKLTWFDNRISTGEYISPEELKVYGDTVTAYIDTSNRLRNVFRYQGYQFTDADEADWATQVAGLNERYDKVYGVYSPHTSEDSWKAYLAEIEQHKADLEYDTEAGRVELAEIHKQIDAAKKDIPGSDYYANILPRKYGLVRPSDAKLKVQDLEAQAKELEDRIVRAEGLQAVSELESYSDPNSKNYDPDFEEKSVYDPTKRSPKKAGGILGLTSTYDSDPYLLYAAINGDEDAIAQLQVNAGSSGASSPEGNNPLGGVYFSTTEGKHELVNMDEKEKKTYNYLAHEYGIAKANEYYALIRSDLFARERYADLLEMQAYTKEHPRAASVSTWLMAPLKGLSYMGQAIDYIDDGRIDENAPYNKFTYTGSDIRNTRAGMIEESWDNALGEGWGKVGSWGYQLGMSMGDFVMATAVSGGNQFMSLAIMGTGAAADTTIAAKQRGLSDDQAFALGTVAGAAEVITEKIGLDALFDVALKGKGALVYTLKNAFSEGLEEPTSSVINTLADLIISGDKAELAMKVQEYIDAGVPEGAALGKVLGEYGLSLLGDAAGGMLSGGFMAIPGTISQSTQYRDVGAKIIKKGTASELKAAADTLGVGTNKFNLSKPGQVGQLYYTVAEKISESGKEALTGEMVKNGVSQKAATKLSGVIIDAWMGVEVDESGMDLIASALKDDNITGAMEVVLNGEDSPVRIAKAQLAGVMEGTEVETVAEDTAEKTPSPAPESASETFEDVQVEDGAQVDSSPLSDEEYKKQADEVTKAYNDGELSNDAYLLRHAELMVRRYGLEAVLRMNFDKMASGQQSARAGNARRAAINSAASNFENHSDIIENARARQLDSIAKKRERKEISQKEYDAEVKRINDAYDRLLAEEKASAKLVSPAARKSDATDSDKSSDMDGKTFLESSGEEVKSISVKRIGKGGAVVTVNGGTEAKLSDVSFGDERTHLAYSRVTSVEGMTAEAANKILNNPKADRFDFINEAIRAFQGGLRNESVAEKLDYDIISADEARALFEEGRKAAAAQAQAAQDLLDEIYQKAKAEVEKTGKKVNAELRYADGLGDVVLEGDQAACAELAARMVPALRGDIVLYDGPQDGKMGYYKYGEDAIYLNVNAKFDEKSMMAFVLAHEMVHRGRHGSPLKYQAFADLLIQEFTKKGVSLDVLIQEQLTAAKEAKVKMTRTQAFEEVICDACQRMLTDTKAGRILAEWGAQNDENRGFLENLKEFLTKLFNTLRKAFAGERSENRAVAAFRALDKSVQDMLAEMYVDMTKDAAEKLSVIKAADLDITREFLAIKDISYNLAAVETHKAKVEETYAKQTNKDGSLKYAAIPINQLMAQYDKVLKMWERIGISLNSAFLEEWNSKVGTDQAFSVFKAQSGYKYNIELSTMCKKGVALFEAIDTLVRKEIMKELGTDVLGKAEKEILYDILKKESFEIPCAICYVEQARQREGVIIDAFLNGNKNGKLGWNQVLTDIEKEMAAEGVAYTFSRVSRDIATEKYTRANISMDAATQSAFYRAVMKLANKEIERYNKAEKKNRPLVKDASFNGIKTALSGNVPSNLKIFKVLTYIPSSRFRIDSDLLYSSNTTHNLAKSHQELYSLFNSQGGVSGYKTKQKPVVYWGDLLEKNWAPSTVRKNGAIRNQSNSDGQMYTLIDMVQMYIDLSAKGYYLQAYTKVVSELKLLGLSGAKINASLIPKVVVYYNSDGTVDFARTKENAGLDENGNPIFDDFEGIKSAEAFMLLEDPEYSRNCGGVCIGYSDNHILRLLDDARIQMIIGFHDKTNDPNKRYYGARYAENYNGRNEAKQYVGKDKKGKDKYETVHVNFTTYLERAETLFKKTKSGDFTGTTTYNGKEYVANDIPRLAADMYLEEYDVVDETGKKVKIPAYEFAKDHPNYYKLLADFALYNSAGEYCPMKKVAFHMPDTVPVLDKNGNRSSMSTEDYIEAELSGELEMRDSLAAKLADESDQGIIPQFRRALKDIAVPTKVEEPEGEVSFSIKKTARMPYGEQLGLIENKQLNGSNSLYIGKPSSTLQSAGLSDKPFAMNQGDYRKARRISAKNSHYSSHAVPYDFFESMPYYLSDAAILIDNGIKVTIISSYPMKDENGQDSFVIAGVHRNQEMENDRVNLVKSAYPLADIVTQITRAAETGRLVITNKNKAEQMLATIGIQPAEVSRILNLAKGSLSQPEADVKQNSSTDSDGRQLSEGQREYFAESAVRDENGNLQVMYHGTSRGGFTIFDVYGSNYGLFGGGSYFTSSRSVAQNYTKKGRGDNPQVYTVYLNIKNPLDMDAQADPAEWAKAFPDATFPESGTNEQFFRAAEEFFEDEGYYTWDAKQSIAESIQDSMGYDGITHIGGGRVNADGERHRVYIAFEQNQIKRTDNLNPTENVDIDRKLPVGEASRMALVDALEPLAKDDKERKALTSYRARIEAIAADEKRLAKTRAEISRLWKSGDRKSDRLTNLRKAEETIRKRLVRADSALLDMEGTGVLKELMERKVESRLLSQRKKLSAEYQKTRKRAVSRVRETAEKRDAVKKMQALVLDCIRWIDHPKKDEIRCPDVLKKPLAEFLSGIDTASKQMSKGGDPTINDLKMANAMHKLAAAIERISKDQSPKDSEDGENGAESDPILDGGYLDLPSDFVQTLREMASEITEMMSNDGYIINEMTAAEVRQLSQLIRTLRHAIREMGTLYANQRFANIQVLGRESVEFMDGLGEIEKSGGLKDFAQWQNALPWYAFKRFGSAGESIFEEMMDGQDKLAFLARELFAFQKKNWSAQEAKMWGEDVHTIELPSGGEITLTTADAMSIFCISRRRIDGRDHGMQHLTGGGVRVIGLQKGSKKAKDSRANLSAQDVAEIVNSLTDRQKAVATAIQQFMSSVCAEWGNEIFMKRFLTKNFTEQFYFPIESNDENLTAQDPSRPQSDMFRLLNISATKPTTPKANNQVIIRNIFDVFTNHATDMAKLNAFGMPLLDYMKWVNYRQKNENQEGQINVTGVRRSMNTAYGSAAWQYVMNLIKDVNGRPSDGGLPGFYKRMLQNAKTAMVGNNLRVATLQVTAYPRAGLVLSSKSLALGLTKRPGKGIQKAKKYCGIALWKSFGFYDTDIAKTMEEQIKGTTDVRRKMIEWSLKGAELGDAITWGALWNACEYEVAATKLYEVGSEEFYHAVALKLREVVYRTQVVDSILTRSETMRSKNAKMKELSSFMSEPTVSANILMDAGFTFSMEKRRYGSAKLAWKNTRRYITRSISVYAIGQLSAALVEALWDTIRSDEDDEEKWEIFLKALGENLVLDLLPFNKIPIVSEFAEAAMSMIGLGYYSTDSLASTGLSQTVSAIGMWAKFGDGKASNDPSVYKAIYKTMQALSSLTGIAGASAMRDLVALWNLIMGAIDEDLKIE